MNTLIVPKICQTTIFGTLNLSMKPQNICVLCKLKYELNRQNLEKLYLIYIRPIFEYACEICDNCGVSNSCKLERIQLEAARIITGLPFFTNGEYLYRETG